MASKKTVNAKNLEALGAARLAELLMEFAGSDAALKRRLRVELADSEGPEAVAQEVRKRIVAIDRAQSFVDWRGIASLANDLDQQREAIVTKIAPRDPSMALDLLWPFMALARSVYERCDDSNGGVGSVFADGCADLCRIAAEAKPDPITLADSVFDALVANHYAEFDGLIEGMTPALGHEGLKHLEGRMRAWGKTAPKEIKDGDRIVGLMSGSRSISQEDMERRHIESVVSLALREIADALGDVDAFIAQHTPKARRTPLVAAAIAERLLTAGRAEEALAAIENVDPENTRFGDGSWERARVAALEAVGRAEDAQAFRWTCFENSLSESHLRAYLKKLPDFEDIAAEERALAVARGWSSVHAALDFLVNWPALDLAAELAIARAAELDGDAYWMFTPAAETLEDRHPLAATVLLRAMIDFTLVRARSSRYGHAARHLGACTRMAGRIDEWGAIEPHEAYLARLKTGHGRKSAFWSRVE